MAKLAYSELTDQVYIVYKNGKKEELTQNFLQVMLLWAHEGNLPLYNGKSLTRSLVARGKKEKEDWEITIKSTIKRT